MRSQLVRRLNLIYLIPFFLLTTSLCFFSTAQAQTMTPNTVQLYEGEDGVVALNVGGVAGIENLVATDFTVQFPANFNIDIKPGGLFSNLTQGQDYLLQVNQNTPEPGLATVAMVLVGDPLPALNQNDKTLVQFDLSAPAIDAPLPAELNITGLQLIGKDGGQLLSAPPALGTTITVVPINGVTVIGAMQLEQLPGPNLPEIGGQFIGLYTNTDTPVPIVATAGITDFDGAFNIQGGNGPVRVYYPPLQGTRPAPDGFLPAVAQLNLTDGPPQQLGTVIRLAGDVVTNGETQGCPAITLEDIMAIARRVGGPPASNGNIYDLNGNSTIEAGDLLMAAVNFNKVGYVEWKNNNGLNTSVCGA